MSGLAPQGQTEITVEGTSTVTLSGSVPISPSAPIVPINKATIFNTAVSANTNIFSTALSPTSAPCRFRIYACLSASGVLSVERTSGSTTIAEQLNGGNALTANASYLFDIVVESGQTINLQYSVAGTALEISVDEIDLA
ncbi:MAG: hypothetical protein QXU98_09495 [Candidatus Parvarchaeota archaeon]